MDKEIQDTFTRLLDLIDYIYADDDDADDYDPRDDAARVRKWIDEQSL